ncbi:MAG: hypothetical protein DWQ04_14925 [Chloroflexi bacterium]|nr:MAG: hypothetical protein DWQ04_14925 [Chloroflexota bacterium]
MYRWDGEEFVQLAGTPFDFSGGLFGEIWEFVEGDDPSRLQIVRTYNGLTTIHEWTGDSYETVEVTIQPVPSYPTDILSISEWVKKGIEQGNYPEVIAFLEEALQKPAADYDFFGAPYYHAMRFVLGMNYVYLEDEEMARSVFENLHDEVPPKFIGFSQAAEAFLGEYDGVESAYEACKTAYDALLATEMELEGIQTTMPLCAFDNLFAERLEQYNGEGNVFDYVNVAEVIYSQHDDLNGDGRLDWLFALSHPTLFPPADVEVWAILQTDGGTEVMKLTRLWAGGEAVEEISAEIHSLPLFDTPLVAVLSNKGLRFLQLIKDEEAWEAKLHMFYGHEMDYSLQMVEDDLQLERFVDAATSYMGVDRITYWWDAEKGEFVEVSRHAPNSLGMPFDDAFDSAKVLILENGDSAAAIPILTAIADEYVPIHDSEWPISLPQMLYLLGLAHEMEGNEAQAVAAYWQLWHDYPTSLYALMAAAKLEEK